jgi:hypothetical protein
MKRLLLLLALQAALLVPARAQVWVVHNLTNDTPANARVPFSGSLLRRSAYEMNFWFRSSSSNALNITNRTIHLSYKPVAALQYSPVMVISGEVVNATSGQARAYIMANDLNLFGDVLFQVSAFDATNRSSFLFQSTVYDSVDHIADTEINP